MCDEDAGGADRGFARGQPPASERVANLVHRDRLVGVDGVGERLGRESVVGQRAELDRPGIGGEVLLGEDPGDGGLGLGQLVGERADGGQVGDEAFEGGEVCAEAGLLI